MKQRQPPDPRVCCCLFDETRDEFCLAHRYGTVVTSLSPPLFGFEGPGGGPRGVWLRLIGEPDRKATARRFGAALELVAAEGHVVLWLDDVREISRQLGLRQAIDSILSLGRSANVLGILSTVDPAYVEGRSQAGIVFVGATNGLAPAKAGAELLGHSRVWWERTGRLGPHEWIYADGQPGSSGPWGTAAPPAGELGRCGSGIGATPSRAHAGPHARLSPSHVACRPIEVTDLAVRWQGYGVLFTQRED